MNRYEAMKEDQQKRFNDFTAGIMFYAFSKKQMEDGLKSLGIKESDSRAMLYATGNGGYYLKSKSKELYALTTAADAELQKALEDDTTGEGFILEAWRYELANHEYCITYDISEALEAIGLEESDLNKPNIKHGLKLALAEYK